MTGAGSDEVVVVVVTYESAALVPDLVASLPVGMGDLAWRLVVVDNASADGTPDVVRALAPDAVVLEMGRNAGYAAGINAGAAYAGPGRALLVLNPDVRLTAGCVPALLAALDQPGTGVAVPRLLDGDGVLVPSMRREPTLVRAVADAVLGASRAGGVGRLGEMVTGAGEYDRAQQTDWAEGSTQLVSAECWRRCGPWDESYFLYSEETDFHLRAGEAGFAVRFVASAEATHLEGDSGTSPRLWALLTANKLRFYGRRASALPTAAYWLALFLRESTRAARRDAIARAATRTLLRPALLRAPRGPEWLERAGATHR